MSEFKTLVENILKEYNVSLNEEDKENDIDYVRSQVKAWEDEIFRQENADDFYYSNGGYSSDSRQLAYWKNKLEKLERASRTPEENARIDAEKAAREEKARKEYEEWKKEEERKRQEEMDKADKEWHYNEGDIVKDKKTGKEWIVDRMFRKYDDKDHKFYYDYYLLGFGDNAKDEYGLTNRWRSGNFPLNRQDLFEPVSKK